MWINDGMIAFLPQEAVALIEYMAICSTKVPATHRQGKMTLTVREAPLCIFFF